MGTPTKYELQRALARAAHLRESGQDCYFIGKALLNGHYRLEHLEKVLALTETYLKFGQDEQEHGRLLKAIAEYHRLCERGEPEAEGFGLE
ncbi:hypothetical protein [Motiliproteus sediminis]|uniref:hypothetical protein n=1 Tax=Motiliproteus sediminis TaxID=1468178 RepID=UPI001AF00569|nr:hypothetical protein [Motiliproteus sediminis]